MLISLIE